MINSGGGVRGFGADETSVSDLVLEESCVCYFGADGSGEEGGECGVFFVLEVGGGGDIGTAGGSGGSWGAG